MAQVQFTSSTIPLRKATTKDKAISNSESQTDHVYQTRHSVDTTKPLVQGLHLLGVGWGVVTLLAITGFCLVRQLVSIIY